MFGDTKLKPDIKYHVANGQHKLDLLVIEVKTPNNNNDDYVKLMLELRHIVTRQATFGVANPVAFGVKVAGKYKKKKYGSY